MILGRRTSHGKTKKKELLEADNEPKMEVDSSSLPANQEHEAKIQRLVAMGHQRVVVERILAQVDYDEETAATALMFAGF
jgi:Holliday junction resolvasome RuvABC DNA-binding subunit